MNKINLLKLADYLDSLPEDYEHFGMDTYFNNLDEDKSCALEAKYARKNGGVNHCGTSACAVGHGPSAGILVPDHMIVNSLSYWGPRFIVKWGDYALEFFTEEDDEGPIWSWCFGGSWEMYDNHHYGAAARIRYLLHHGRPPEDFTYADHDWTDTYKEFRKC